MVGDLPCVRHRVSTRSLARPTRPARWRATCPAYVTGSRHGRWRDLLDQRDGRPALRTSTGSRPALRTSPGLDTVAGATYSTSEGARGRPCRRHRVSTRSLARPTRPARSRVTYSTSEMARDLLDQRDRTSPGLDTVAGATYSTSEIGRDLLDQRRGARPALPTSPGLDTVAGATYSTSEMGATYSTSEMGATYSTSEGARGRPCGRHRVSTRSLARPTRPAKDGRDLLDQRRMGATYSTSEGRAAGPAYLTGSRHGR